jgi:hypothetical protein
VRRQTAAADDADAATDTTDAADATALADTSGSVVVVVAEAESATELPIEHLLLLCDVHRCNYHTFFAAAAVAVAVVVTAVAAVRRRRRRF